MHTNQQLEAGRSRPEPELSPMEVYCFTQRALGNVVADDPEPDLLVLASWYASMTRTVHEMFPDA